MEASGLSAQSSQLIEDDNKTDETLIYHLRITDPVAETGDQHLRRNNATKENDRHVPGRGGSDFFEKSLSSARQRRIRLIKSVYIFGCVIIDMGRGVIRKVEKQDKHSTHHIQNQ